MSAPTVRAATPGESARIKQIAVDNEMFDADEVDAFDELLDGFFDGSLEGHEWLVAEHDERVVGGAYVAPEPFGDRVWNLHFLAVAPETHGAGAGSALLRHVESLLRELGAEQARLMIIETSSTASYSGTRAFYRDHGFVQESTIREYYGPGDHKVTFWKTLVG